MATLPLFPLPVVLFPGTLLPLHIFEPRYRRMVARCLEFDRRFGLVFHDPDRAGPFLVDEGRVGAVAEILDFRPLPDGRSLIMTRGEERFRIVEEVDEGRPYYEADVEAYEDWEEAPPDLKERRRRSLALFRSAMESLPQPPERIPEFDVAEELSFRLAATVDIDPGWQQSLLELRDERDRLDRLDVIFQAVADQEGEPTP